MYPIVSKGQRWRANRSFRTFTKLGCYTVHPQDTLRVLEDAAEEAFVNGHRVCLRRVLWQEEEAFVLPSRFDGESLTPIIS